MSTRTNSLPKRRDAGRTREAILKAAQAVFSSRSYVEAGVRDITKLADVNSALVSRYFGSKEGLFEAALSAALDATPLVTVDRKEFGRSVVSSFLSDDAARVNPLPMLVLAASDATAREIALRLLQARIVAPLAEWLGKPRAEERAAQVMAVATGFFTFRILLPLSPMRGHLSPPMREWLAETLQQIVDAP